MDDNPFLPIAREAGVRDERANRTAAAAAGCGLVSLAVYVARGGADEAMRCIDCGACNAVGDACPGAIEDEAGLVAAARRGDATGFVVRAGLMCTRCGVCSSFCPVGLDLARIFAGMHAGISGGLARGAVEADVVRQALRDGRVGGEFIEDALRGLGER